MFASPDTLTHVHQAVALLRRGGLVAFPTETVYGLGADAENLEALARLYAAKGRPGHHPVIVHLADVDQVAQWASDVPPAARMLADAFWPGPLTLILPRSGRVPDAVTGGQDTVGLRVPSHPLALQLLQAFGGGIAAPSANRFGRISPTTAAHVQAELGSDVDLILDGGACPVGVESTIVAFREGQPVILRPGMITAEQIAAVLRQEASRGEDSASTIRVPGSLSSHYAPTTPVSLVSAGQLVQELVADAEHSLGVLAYEASAAPTGLSRQLVWRTMPRTPEAYAQRLYATLRELDALELDRILVEAVPETGAWWAIADRLKRAAASK